MKIVKKFENFSKLELDEIKQLVLDAITMMEDPNGKCVHSYDYEELARDISDQLYRK